MSFTVYKSSAGSGKTFTLVKEYLKLALSDPSEVPNKYRHILAITFTNKAAAEMKERILRYLNELAGGNESIILDAIVEETGLETAVIKKRAKRILDAILHNYSDFSVCTIDSFVHRIVRAFAFELKLPVNFEVETDADKILTQAIDLLISKIGEDEKLTRTLIGFAESKTDDEKNWHIENDLHAFASTLLKDDSTSYISKLKEITVDDFFVIRDELVADIKKFENAVRDLSLKAYTSIQTAGISHQSFYRGSQGLGKYFQNISEERFDKLQPNSYAIATIEENKWASSKATASDKAALESIKAGLTASFTELQVIKEQQYPRYILNNMVFKNIYSLAVLNETEKLLSEFKTSNNILHISEFNKLISTVVLEQPIPFIYEHMGEKYSHFLIDEFQDTSELQWQNLLPLIDNSLAENNFNMIVGDGKQAIYRWRGGEVEQFVRLPKLKNPSDNELINERERSLENHFSEKNLATNYRSKAEIIDFNNKFFRAAAEQLHPSSKDIYLNLEQIFNENNNGGGVAIEFIDHADKKLNERTCERTLELIELAQKDNYKKKDIALLARNNREASQLANFLTSKGIQVISSESLLLKNSASVNFIISTLSYIRDPGDSVAKTSMVSHLLKKAPGIQDLDAAIQRSARATVDKLSEQLMDLGYEFKLFLLLKIPLYELCEEVVRIFRLNNKVNAHVQFFLDEVLNYSLKYTGSLSDFLEWWEIQREKSSLVIPAGADAVSIMSIHKSKGLEFPIVIFPFANWAQGKSDSMWVDLDEAGMGKLKSAVVACSSELEQTVFAGAYEIEKNKKLLDNINLLYVAMTRAVERLYILTSAPQQQKNISSLFINFLNTAGVWKDGQTQYLFGPFAPKVSEDKKGPPPYTLHESISNDWREKIKIRANSEEIWESAEVTQKKEYGILLHRALSTITNIESLGSSLHEMMAEGLLNMEDKSTIEASLARLLVLPAVKPYFESGLQLKNETEILLPDGSSYRPDRVIISGSKATVIDYKTGKAKEEHRKQLDHYQQIMQQMGFDKVEKVLIYTEDGAVEIL